MQPVLKSWPSGLIAAAALLLAASPAAAAQAPVITAAYANSPGAVTVAYAHGGGDGVRNFRLEQQGASVARFSANLADTFTVLGLQANTQYSFRVCAAYDGADACTAWFALRTMATPPPPSGPPAPPPITSVTARVNSVTLGWGALDPRYNKILARIEDMHGGSQQQDIRPDPNRYWTFFGLQPGTPYRVLMKGCSFSLNNSCNGWGAPVPVTTPTVGPPHPSTVRSLRSGGGLCLDVDYPNMQNNGARIQVWQCNGTPQQHWVFVGATIRNANGKCLDVDYPHMHENGARVQGWDCNGSPQQTWRMDGAALVNGGGKCLDVHYPDLHNNGGRVQAWDCNRTPQQSWSWAP